MRLLSSLIFCLSISLAIGVRVGVAQPNGEQAPGEATQASCRDQLFRRFKETLSGVKLVGKFTIVGRDDSSPRDEEYTIESVEKHADGDFWIFLARIKYGNQDLRLPLKLEVKWAEDTPVITLTNLTIPGLGTFSSRVVIDGGKYAGTWSHGEVNGHLFGVIRKLSSTESSSSKAG
jgi:hypothetical protein